MAIPAPFSADPFRALADATPDGVIAIDPQSVIHFVNAAVQPLFGYAPEEDEAHFLTCWNHAMVTRVRPALERYLAPLPRHLEQELLDLAGGMLRRPALARVVRERFQREAGRQRLPLNTWARLFEHLGWRYTALRRTELGNLHLFVIQG